MSLQGWFDSIIHHFLTAVMALIGFYCGYAVVLFIIKMLKKYRGS